MTPRPCRGGAGVGSASFPHTTSSIFFYLIPHYHCPHPWPNASPLSPLQGARGTLWEGERSVRHFPEHYPVVGSDCI